MQVMGEVLTRGQLSLPLERRARPAKSVNDAVANFNVAEWHSVAATLLGLGRQHTDEEVHTRIGGRLVMSAQRSSSVCLPEATWDPAERR